MMIGQLRVKSPWSQLGLVFGLLGAGVILTSIILAFIVFTRGLPVAALDKLDWSQPHVLATMKLVQAISSITIFLVPAIAFGLLVFNRQPIYSLGVRPAAKTQMYLLACICILASIPFVIWLGDVNQLVPLPKWMTKMERDAGRQMAMFLKASNNFDVVVNVFIIALLPALCEEIFFRGVLQRIVIQICKNSWAGIIITAVIFSAAHLQFEGFLPRMFLGFILGTLYWYSGSLWPGILAHFINNAVQVVAVSYAPEYMDKNPSLPAFAAVVSGLAVAILLWIYKSYSAVTYEQVYPRNLPDSVNDFPA